MKSKLLLVALAWFMMMCSSDEPEANGPGHVTFGVPSNLLPGGRTSVEEFDEAIVTIKSTSGEVVYDGKISLTLFGESYVSEQLQLNTGAYTLEKFILVESNVAKYASPLTGSPKAPLVEHPLPLGFSIQTSEVTTLRPEVVAVGDASPGQFGYVEFGFEVINENPAILPLHISATIAADKAHAQLVGGAFEVLAKNAAGQITWSKTWPIDNQKQILIPAAHRYAFVLSKAGHIPHKQYYTANDLTGVTSLSFELIPEGSKDFIVEHFFNDSLTMYLAADRRKLYQRFDRVEGFDVAFVSTDRVVRNRLASVGWIRPYQILDLDETDGTKDLVGSINIFYNAPFSEAVDIRETTDMSTSPYTKDFDRDVEVVAYTIVISSGVIDEARDHITYWDFDWLPFDQYWCSVTGLGMFCHFNDGRTGSPNMTSDRQNRRASAIKKHELLMIR